MNVYKEIEEGFTAYDNWRYLKSIPGVYDHLYNYHGSYDSVLESARRVVSLLGNYFLINFPNITIIEYLNNNNSILGEVINEEQLYPASCKKCYGAGKFDWISNIVGQTPSKSKYEFIRNKRVVLLYRKDNGIFLDNFMFAPTEINDSERICEDCLGTGICFEDINIDGYPILKNNLIPYDIRYFKYK